MRAILSNQNAGPATCAQTMSAWSEVPAPVRKRVAIGKSTSENQNPSPALVRLPCPHPPQPPASTRTILTSGATHRKPPALRCCSPRPEPCLGRVTGGLRQLTSITNKVAALANHNESGSSCPAVHPQARPQASASKSSLLQADVGGGYPFHLFASFIATIHPPSTARVGDC